MNKFIMGRYGISMPCGNVALIEKYHILRYENLKGLGRSLDVENGGYGSANDHQSFHINEGFKLLNL